MKPWPPPPRPRPPRRRRPSRRTSSRTSTRSRARSGRCPPAERMSCPLVPALLRPSRGQRQARQCCKKYRKRSSFRRDRGPRPIESVRSGKVRRSRPARVKRLLFVSERSADATQARRAADLALKEARQGRDADGYRDAVAAVRANGGEPNADPGFAERVDGRAGTLRLRDGSHDSSGRITAPPRGRDVDIPRADEA